MLVFCKRRWCPTSLKNGYVQTCSYCQKSKFQIIHCSKQMWDLLTAAWISKGNHQTIGKLDILCVLLGFGLDLEEICSTLKRLHFGFVQKKMVPNVMKKTTAMYKHVVIAKNRNSRLYTAVSRCGICLLQRGFQKGTIIKPLEN